METENRLKDMALQDFFFFWNLQTILQGGSKEEKMETLF
jgi:hypothetical protein